MQTTLSKWGNSIALRVPKSIVKELNLVSSQKVNLRVENGKALIEPVSKSTRLSELLDGITSENLHGELSFGASVGKETL